MAATNSRFAGKVAMVTGSGSGLGREFVRAFAADGAQVIVADVDEAAATAVAQEIVRDDGEALSFGMDVTSKRQSETVLEQVKATFGGVDILVNNAAIWRDYRLDLPILEMDEPYFDKVVAVNLKGPLLVSQAVVPYMRSRGWGRIVNISSIGAWSPVGGVYSVTKLALHQLTFQIAAEVGKDGITCNAVAPGHIWNESTQSQLDESVHQKSVAGMLVKRAGTAADLYGAIAYLCSEEASWVTAQVISPNGGSFARL